MKIELLSHIDEDAFLIEIGKFSMLIDSGNSSETLNKINEKDFNMLIVTHTDNDHICNSLEILEKKLSHNDFNKDKNYFLIFNNPKDSKISYSQGNRLIDIIIELQKNYDNFISIKTNLKENKSKVETIEKIDLDNIKLKFYNCCDRKEPKENIIQITFITPIKENLNKLYDNWNINKLNSKLINKASISFLMEYNGITILFTADAYLSDIEECLEEMPNLINKIDLIKIPHHGSPNNNKNLIEFANKYSCKQFILSTNKNENIKFINNNIEDIKEGLEIFTSNICGKENYNKYYTICDYIKYDYVNKKFIYWSEENE